MKAKQNYQKPNLELVDIKLDSSIAAGSSSVSVRTSSSETKEFFIPKGTSKWE